jgi:hypothetical protein
MILAALLLGGCASYQPTPEPPQSTGAERAAEPRPAGPRGPHIELTEDILYPILVAEFAGQRGQIDLALKSYMDLARQVPDPRIAERATGIAVFAKHDAEAREAARRWVQLAPTDIEARQVLAALLIRNGEVDEA